MTENKLFKPHPESDMPELEVPILDIRSAYKMESLRGEFTIRLGTRISCDFCIEYPNITILEADFDRLKRYLLPNKELA